MIPVTQTKVVVKNKKEELIIRGNCFAACIASLLELPISEVPNVETLFHIQGNYWQEVMLTFLNSKGYDLCTDDRFRVFHDDNYGVTEGKRQEWLLQCNNKYYLVSGKSNRGVNHIVIYQNGKMVHDPHPTKEGIVDTKYFQTLEKI
jgi:hypothetical protein